VRQVNECVPAVDEGVGQLVEALRQTGQLDDTLIVYTADQGFAMGEHGMRIKLAPHDAAYRSPLIVSMPARFARGKTCDVPVNGADLTATLCAAAGVQIPWPLHGRDVAPAAAGPGGRVAAPDHLPAHRRHLRPGGRANRQRRARARRSTTRCPGTPR
jgi:arylsulfatase A-like enzyme